MRMVSTMARPADVSRDVWGTITGTGRRSGPARWSLAEETPVAILVNGEHFAVVMATPADLEDFALGFAMNEGIVRDPSGLLRLAIAEAADGFVVNLRVSEEDAFRGEARRRNLPARASCGICGAQTLAAAVPALPKVRGILPRTEAVLSAFAAFPGFQDMRRENRSTHAAALCDADGTILVVREDIGRHSALDKVAGAAARLGPDVSRCFLLLSSRIGFEMVQKAAAIGVPFVAAASAPSGLSLRVAAEAGLTLAVAAEGALMIFDHLTVEEPAA
ncbi:formate dehydrogenase accessory sulfurtransferase FdhD [Nisaea acidiphila]|uniref:Sulfur carrier protein FdhD n=1 Tax=Nisaea acidiphila TaxID=1862145 RepID=A0A9J7AP33_9PROT|nr:formate dehydrogenase accessory sulfurtransferase FdhD [Nisaea acidiphila]UUX48967.1 formate dehydrogenase accessory sulfurtransferase FdhD [Nisaea acidiphila]